MPVDAPPLWQYNLHMPYIIDGHNLIPKIPGLSLEDLDDETQLIQVLQEFCRLSRKQVEVYFDNAPAGSNRQTTYGIVKVRFVRAGSSADEAIHLRLQRMGRGARNWTVVSSDHRVQEWARQARSEVMPSEDFADLMKDTLRKAGVQKEKPDESSLSADEVDEWLKIFSDRNSRKQGKGN
jgi:hypothetical protein